MYTTDDVIAGDVAAALGIDVADLPAKYQGQIPRTHVASYQEIFGQLLARGFTPAQITAWDRGEEFERSIALYFVFSTPQAAGVFDKEAMSVWDRRKELCSVIVSAGTVWSTPSDTPGNVGIGQVTQTGDCNTAPQRW